MSEPHRSIFRREALERHAQRRGSEGAARGPSAAGKSARTGAVKKHRVPVILQLNSVECGLACLAMMLSYFGRKTALSECRRLYAPGRDGVSAAMLAKLGRSFGLLVKGLSLDIDALASIGRPVIAHWGFDHFVIVEWVAEERVGIVDPGLGRLEMDRHEFALQFTGVILVFEPGESFDRRVVRKPPVWRPYVLALVRRSRGMLVQILAASALLQVFGLALPLLTRLVVDDLLPAKTSGILGLVGAGIAVWIAAFAVMTYLRTRLLISLQSRLDAHMMMDFFEHVLRLPYRFFQQRATGDLLSRLRSNGDIRDVLTSQTVSMILDGCMVVVYLGILFAKEPRIAMLTLAIGAAQLGLVFGTARRINDLMQRELTAQAESQSFLVEALKGVATIKVAGNEDETFAHWSRLFNRNLGISVERSRLTGSVDSALTALRLLAPLVVLWLGAQRVLAGVLSPGTMLAFSALASMVLLPLSSLAADVQKLQLVGAHLDRVADVLEARPEQDEASVASAPRLTGQIEIRNLGFRYDDNGPWVLQNIDLRIEPGQKVALVGRTGSGKTTLAMLLLGLYEPSSGELLFEGSPSHRMNYRELRRQIGVVLQDPFLFGGSIRDNIALGGRESGLDAIVAAARLAAVHEDIAHMPMGYQTRVAEGSGGLSGGQRQRIAIARALVNRPALLVFDEATSHLDSVTERQVDTNISGLLCTRIVIAHRLSTVRNADQIIVLDQGKIVERGTHENLVALGGHYAELVSRNEPENA